MEEKQWKRGVWRHQAESIKGNREIKELRTKVIEVALKEIHTACIIFLNIFRRELCSIKIIWLIVGSFFFFLKCLVFLKTKLKFGTVFVVFVNHCTKICFYSISDQDNQN